MHGGAAAQMKRNRGRKRAATCRVCAGVRITKARGSQPPQRSAVSGESGAAARGGRRTAREHRPRTKATAAAGCNTHARVFIHKYEKS